LFQQGTEQDQDTVFAHHTQPQSRRARTRVFGLFVAVWVSLALQPCAVAAVSESDCPHCPPEIEAVDATMESHCNPAAKATHDDLPNCDSVQAACCDLDKGIVSVRVDTTGVDDDNPGLPTSVPASHPSLGPCEESGSAAGPPQAVGGSVPLHVLKCVYLD
jgi:hypothetical protein